VASERRPEPSIGAAQQALLSKRGIETRPIRLRRVPAAVAPKEHFPKTPQFHET
jgi:hypothetical protein